MRPSEREARRIIVVGGGVAGLILATRLGHLLGRRALARINLVDRSWIHVWKPMLHTFAAGTWNFYQQQVQYVAHARTHHFEYVPGQLDAIDRAARRIRLAPLKVAGEAIAGARELGYDVLVLAGQSVRGPPTNPYRDDGGQALIRINAERRAHSGSIPAHINCGPNSTLLARADEVIE
jgi:NADPH-dependent 2,4-dienoyl-CoA reductase/sulfur reductase-like enzyme